MEDYKLPIDFVSGLVSIIIPTHNRGDLILETLESIINQTYKNIEIIVVDDHSTDHTERVIDSFIKKIKKNLLYYIKSDKYGACAARNIGFSHAKGEYIQFFDDDDIMAINHISKKVNVMLLDKEIDFVTCNFLYFKSQIENIVGSKQIDNISHSIESHLLNMAFPAPAYFFRRKSIIKLGLWDETCLKCQDIRYYHRLFLYEMKGYWLRDFLFYVRIHDNSITKRYSKKILSSTIATFDAIEKEWRLKCDDKSQISKVKRIVTFNKLGFLNIAFCHNYYLWGINTILSTVLLRPKDSFYLMIFYIQKKICKNHKNLDLFYGIK